MQQWLTKLFPCHKVVENPGMNPGPPHHHNLELKATKAWALQALSFRGFFAFWPRLKARGKKPAGWRGADFGGFRTARFVVDNCKH
jgi:hypothetical protein